MLQELLSLLLALPVLVPIAFFFAGCACCGNPCCSGTLPSQVQVVLDGVKSYSVHIVNGQPFPPLCTNCEAIDGTYVLDASLVHECQYIVSPGPLQSHCSVPDSLIFEYGETAVRITDRYSAFAADMDDGISVESLACADEQTIPLSNTGDGSPGNQYCDWSAATAVITPL